MLLTAGLCSSHISCNRYCHVVWLLLLLLQQVSWWAIYRPPCQLQQWAGIHVTPIGDRWMTSKT
jgi:hypothetical protein